MIWKLFPIVPIFTFASSAYGVAVGDFGEAEFPEVVEPLHIWLNGFEALGWLTVFVMGLSGLYRWASKASISLAGMWCWDMITTMLLSMPVPPFQIVWGPISVILMLLFAYHLNQMAKKQAQRS